MQKYLHSLAPARALEIPVLAMRWQRPAIYAVMFFAWVALAAWQYQQHQVQREQIEETLHQQSHSVMNALVGGIRSHRRLGRFFEMQLEGMLQELVKAADVRAVRILSEDGLAILSAGEVELLDQVTSNEPGDHWDPAGFRLVESFWVQPADPLADEPGPGRGMGRRWQEYERTDGAFAEGGRFLAVLLLDRTRCDMLVRRSARSHGFVIIAGALVLLCLALAWRASVRMVEAQGQARVLEIETRHFRELSQAAAGLAHETRNPLGLIRGWTQRFAENEMTAADRQQHAQTMIEECDRVTARINQFLAFARPCEPEVGDVNVCELIEELSVILRPDLELKELTLQCERDATISSIRADRELLRQALFNLVQNAIQFAPCGDTISVTINADHGGRYRIEVADHGPGVARDAVDSLFTPYYTTRPDGTGLGLAIVRRIAVAHGWEAVYSSRHDGGAIFSLEGIHG
jgi:signal transduction histidine kinase